MPRLKLTLTDEQVKEAVYFCEFKRRNTCKGCLAYEGDAFKHQCRQVHRRIYELVQEKEKEVDDLKAEIEKQRKEAQILRDEIIKLQTKIEIVKIEAYKEFADRLKEKNRSVGILRQGDIDNLLKELTERKEDK